jgi:hypothetical protein
MAGSLGVRAIEWADGLLRGLDLRQKKTNFGNPSLYWASLRDFT